HSLCHRNVLHSPTRDSHRIHRPLGLRRATESYSLSRRERVRGEREGMSPHHYCPTSRTVIVLGSNVHLLPLRSRSFKNLVSGLARLKILSWTKRKSPKSCPKSARFWNSRARTPSRPVPTPTPRAPSKA